MDTPETQALLVRTKTKKKDTTQKSKRYTTRTSPKTEVNPCTREEQSKQQIG